MTLLVRFKAPAVHLLVLQPRHCATCRLYSPSGSLDACSNESDATHCTNDVQCIGDLSILMAVRTVSW